MSELPLSHLEAGRLAVISRTSYRITDHKRSRRLRRQNKKPSNVVRK
jgi:hypothetical protein